MSKPSVQTYAPLAATPPGLTRPGRQRVLALIRWFAFVVLGTVALLTPGFLSLPSLVSLLTTMSFAGSVAIGMTLITISGNIMAFSLGATVGASAMIFIAAVNYGGLAFGAIAALVFGGAVSAAQGAAVGYARANPIIVSIAALSLILGVAEGYAQNGGIYASANAHYGFLRDQIGSIPIDFVIFVCMAAFVQALLGFTTFGRNVYMIGNSFPAAEAAGVRTALTITGVYACAGVCAAIAGVMLAARYGSATMAYGSGYDYDAIAAILVGGTVIRGGEGSALRTLVGVLFVAIIQALLLLRGFPQEWQYLVGGAIVLIVMLLQTRGAER